MKWAVSEKNYDSRNNVQAGDYMGVGQPGKIGKLRSSYEGNSVPMKSKQKNTSPKKIG